MAHAAIFGAGGQGPARLLGDEPFVGLAAGHHLFFDPEVGNEEGVDDVARCHAQHHRLAHRNLDLVGAGDAVAVVEIPVELVGGDLNLHRPHRHRALVLEENPAVGRQEEVVGHEHHRRHHREADRLGGGELGAAADIVGAFGPVPPQQPGRPGAKHQADHRDVGDDMGEQVIIAFGRVGNAAGHGGERRRRRREGGEPGQNRRPPRSTLVCHRCALPLVPASRKHTRSIQVTLEAFR